MNKSEFIACPYNPQHIINRNDTYNHFFFRCKAAKNSKIKYKSCKYDNANFFIDETAHKSICTLCQQSEKRLNDLSEVSTLVRKSKQEKDLFSEESVIKGLEESVMDQSVHNQSILQLGKDIF